MYGDMINKELRFFHRISGGSLEVYQLEKALEPGTIISISGILVFLHFEQENLGMQRISWDPQSDKDEYFAIWQELKEAVAQNFAPDEPAA